jgi:hypothetical protein
VMIRTGTDARRDGDLAALSITCPIFIHVDTRVLLFRGLPPRGLPQGILIGKD